MPRQKDGALRVRQNGKRVDSDWDYEKRLFRCVSEGEYTLRIPSSAEVRKRVLGLLPEFEGADVPFEVKADSPIELDLGEIRLK